MNNLAVLLLQSHQLQQAQQLLQEAVPHHQAALEASPQNAAYRLGFRNNRANLTLTLLRIGDYDRGAETAEQLAQMAVDPANDLYKASYFMAACSERAEHDPKRPPAERNKLAQEYENRAMALLRRAVASGFKDLAQIRKLTPLLRRDDCKKMLGEIESNSGRERGSAGPKSEVSHVALAEREWAAVGQHQGDNP